MLQRTLKYCFFVVLIHLRYLPSLFQSALARGLHSLLYFLKVPLMNVSLVLLALFFSAQRFSEIASIAIRTMNFSEKALCASLTINSVSALGTLLLSPIPSVCRSEVYCGKTADWIRMPFGVVSGVGRWMGVLNAGGDRRKGRGSFGGKCGASHCNR